MMGLLMASQPKGMKHGVAARLGGMACYAYLW
jgi:hypothetical protein